MTTERCVATKMEDMDVTSIFKGQPQGEGVSGPDSKSEPAGRVA